MSLTLGDVLAIVFGSLLFLLLLGYLLYSYVFRNKQEVTIEQMVECIRKNPNCRDSIKKFIQRAEQDDIRQLYINSNSMGDYDYDREKPTVESYKPPTPKQEINTVFDQVDDTVRMKEIKPLVG